MTGEWMDIETAPKDGTRILAFGSYVDFKGYEMITVTSWSEGNEEFKDAGEGLYRKVKEFGWGSGFRATHWMLLPVPPEVTA